MKKLELKEGIILINDESYEKLLSQQEEDFPHVTELIKELNKDKSILYDNDLNGDYKIDKIYQTKALKDVLEIKNDVYNVIEIRSKHITFSSFNTKNKISLTRDNVEAILNFFDYQDDI